MDPLNLFFGIIGIASFGFSVYTYYKAESKKIVEAANIAMHKERYRNIRHGLKGILYAVDAVVQIPKQGKVSTEDLQNFARVARAQVLVLTEQVELEQKRLDGWKYGKLFSSEINLNETTKEDEIVGEKNADE